MSETLTVAMCSSIANLEDKSANLSKYIRWAKKAAAKGADLISFPELALTGYQLTEPGEPSVLYDVAETIPGPSVNRLISAAKENNIYIIMGMYEADTEYLGMLYNTAVFVGPEGLVGKYRKLTIESWGPFEMNKNGVGGGYEIPVWEIRQGWRIGITICLDMWVPEIPRIEVLKGADLIVVISAGPAEVEEGWIHVNNVRAIENTTGLSYCNIAGDEHGLRFFGGRMAVEAGGEVLVPMEGSADTEGMSIATFSAEKLYNARKTIPAEIRDRNPAAYQRLIDPRRHIPDFIPYRGKRG
jgi:predicted amidohydrolase